MGRHDHYVFMDGCIVKGCKPVIDLAHSFGEYIALLTDLYEQGGWGQRPPGGLLRRARPEPFAEWAERQVHSAQSTQNLRTGAARVDGILRSIGGDAAIHLFGTSAAGSAILEYFLLTDPATLYDRAHDEHRGGRRPASIRLTRASPVSPALMRRPTGCRCAATPMPTAMLLAPARSAAISWPTPVAKPVPIGP